MLRARLAIAHLLDANPRTPEKWARLARIYLTLAAADAGTPQTNSREPPKTAKSLERAARAEVLQMASKYEEISKRLVFMEFTDSLREQRCGWYDIDLVADLASRQSECRNGVGGNDTVDGRIS